MLDNNRREPGYWVTTEYADRGGQDTTNSPGGSWLPLMFSALYSAQKSKKRSSTAFQLKVFLTELLIICTLKTQALGTRKKIQNTSTQGDEKGSNWVRVSGV